MPETHSRLNEQEHGALTRMLADFAAWLTPPWVDQNDQAHYHELATRFLSQRRPAGMIDTPKPERGLCDLCGQAFTLRPIDRLESITGNNYLWCVDCLLQQEHVFKLLGAHAYRAAWERDAERNGNAR